MNDYEIRMFRVRQGLGCMMASYWWLAGSFVCDWLFATFYSDASLRWWGGFGVFACGLIYVGSQFTALGFCWLCPKEAVRGGKWWIFASGMFYGMFFPAVFFMPMWVAVGCFLLSGWFWQIFLLDLARGMGKVEWLGIEWNIKWTTVAWCVFLLFSVAGFCWIFVYEVSKFSRYYGSVWPPIGFFSGLGFLGLYLYLLTGLRRMLAEEAWEENNSQERSEAE